MQDLGIPYRPSDRRNALPNKVWIRAGQNYFRQLRNFILTHAHALPRDRIIN
jgi:hypothetical protein